MEGTVSSQGSGRAEVTAELEREFRRFSLQSGFWMQAIADHLGINRTDLEVLALVWERSPLAAGQLSEATNLTTGAITGVIDRLEKGGFVQRESDPADRRRVLVRTIPEMVERVSRVFFEPALRETARLYDQFTDEELATITRYARAAAPLVAEQTARLRATPARAPGAPEHAREQAAPLGGATRGRLEFASGAARLALRVDPDAAELYRARFEGTVPTVRVTSGTVRIAYPRFRPFDWRRQAAEVTLSGRIPWEIALLGGVSRLEADLRGASLRSLDVTGGASDVDVRLPEPVGTVAVTITGGASKVRFRRPPAVPARFRVKGGASQVVFDRQRLGAVGGGFQLESPDLAGGRDRYEFEVTGGASKISVETE
jgi:DNA-binding MarR family transcriptional regulator